MIDRSGEELDSSVSPRNLNSLRSGATGALRSPVTIWVVRDGDDLYVRSVNGRGSSWFRGAQTRQEGRIRAVGIERDVSLIDTDESNDEIDTAYEAKYGGRYPTIVPSIVAPEALAATLRIVPRSTGGA